MLLGAPRIRIAVDGAPSSRRARRTSARAARTTARRSCPRDRSPAAGSAATAWRCSPGADRGQRIDPDGRRGRAVDRAVAVHRRRTSSRTSATARSSTPGSSPCRRVAAGVNITYKILSNGAVAMTGGQDAAGGLRGPGTDPQARRRGRRARSSCAPTTRALRPRRALRRRRAASGTATGSTRPSASCARRPGVTALIYDQPCAADLRRKRKRGELPSRRTSRGHQRGGLRGLRRLRRQVPTACRCSRSTPRSAARPASTRPPATSTTAVSTGDCPSFVTVELPPARARRGRRERPEPPAVPDSSGRRQRRRVRRRHRRHRRRHGGPGAARPRTSTGSSVSSVDQTGMAQKGGPVVSHLRLAPDRPRSARPSGSGRRRTATSRSTR